MRQKFISNPHPPHLGLIKLPQGFCEAIQIIDLIKSPLIQ